MGYPINNHLLSITHATTFWGNTFKWCLQQAKKQGADEAINSTF
jgi:hypothetical protein